jgi:hypothetical protein
VGKGNLKKDVDYMSNCVFIDEAGFHVNLRRTQGWAPKDEPSKVKLLTARTNTIFWM